jgi:hypothetical protein
MRIGEYRIVIENVEGQVLAEVERTAATGHPIVGEEILLDGSVFVVERVRHEEDADTRARRRYTSPRLFVRRHDGLVQERRKEPARAPPRVLLFPGGPRSRRLESVIFPPSLLVVLVACGYDAQARHFARRSRGGARLMRIGQGWFVEAGESPAEALLLAREARHQRQRLQRWIDSWARAMDESPWRIDRAVDERHGGRLNDGAACPWPLPWSVAWRAPAIRAGPSARAA